MAAIGADLNAAYNVPQGISAKWNEENPQLYDKLQSYNVHSTPQRHILGIVGGNEVIAPKADVAIDIESDLRGITRPNTFAPWRQYSPPVSGDNTIKRNTTKGAIDITIPSKPLPEYQMWSYPVVPTPVPFIKEQYGTKEQY